MKKRLLALVLLAAMVAGMICTAAAANSDSNRNGTQQSAIVYIPLDDRPLSMSRVQQLADSLDLTLVMPDQDLFATKLDGQAKNANGTQCGDRGTLLEWLMEQSERYDTFLISLDQLLSGGLMNSRCMTEMEPIVLPDGRKMTEYEVIDYIGTLSQTKHVYIIDSILRIALSSGYGGYEGDAYNLTRSYGMKARPVLSGEELTVERIIQNYPNCIATQNTAAPSAEASDAEQEIVTAMGLETTQESQQQANVTQQNAVLAQYLKIRERKLRLVDYAVQKLVLDGKAEYVLGVDDSSAGNNIHTNEIAYVQQLAGQRITMLSALDGIAQMILSRFYGEQTGTQGTTMGIQYFGFEKDWVPAFNYMTVNELLDSTASYLHASITKDSGDISLLLVASGTDSAKNQTEFTRLIAQINQNEQNGIPTVLLDFTNQDRAKLHEMLIDSVHLGVLLSYSGNYDNVIQVPMALSYGISRFRSLSQNVSQQAKHAQVGTIVTSMVEEYYRSDGVSSMVSQQLSTMGANGNNFATEDQAKLGTYQQILDQNMKRETTELMENITGSNAIVGLMPYTTAAISKVEIPSYWFPWNRTFEIQFAVSCALSDSAYSYDYHDSFISGMGDGTFHPEERLSRNQAARMLISASETPVLENVECPFENIEAWATAYVTTAYQKHYMSGYEDGTFRGSSFITRAEFAAMLVQYMNAEQITLKPVTELTFSDVPKDGSAWYTDQVYLLARGGMISGYEDGTFRPESTITRTEAVAMLARMFGRKDAAPDWTKKYPVFRDVSTSHWGYAYIAEASVGHYAS